jgi:hypothetical protein
MSNTKEAAVVKTVQINASAKGWRLFRNAVGMAWQGKLVGRGVESVALDGARRVPYGLGVGSSDLVGWRPVVITPDMVGKTVAQFCAVECKTPAYPDTTPEQDAFLDAVAAAGGAAYIARGESDGSLEMYQVGAP